MVSIRSHGRRVVAVTIALSAASGYAWWVSGLRPFTMTCYVLVCLPTVLVACVVIARPRGGAPPIKPRQALPWLLLLAIAVVLEGAGLALGGRSASVPTLSTVIDHALAWHALRMLLYLAWLAIAVPLLRDVPAGSSS
jgi:hypothetical protein